MTQKRPVIFGEVLFDCFPDGTEVLGGAPFNVAWHLQGFGLKPVMISRVGNDRMGENVLKAMRQWGMDTDFLQIDHQRPTGTVKVKLINGEPAYDISPEDAYGSIQDEFQELVDGSPFLYHGSLALWKSSSRNSLDKLKQKCNALVFMDVNLRAPWWESETVLSLLDNTSWVKLNEEELRLLTNSNDSLEQKAKVLLERFQPQLQALIVTRASKGASVYLQSGQVLSVAPSSAPRIIDTVGAGDAFSAVFILGLTMGWPGKKIINRAQEFASSIIAHRGATVSDRQLYTTLLTKWGNDQTA